MLSGLWPGRGAPTPCWGTAVGRWTFDVVTLTRWARKKGVGVAGRSDSGVSLAPFQGSSWGWVAWEVVAAHFS